MPADPSRISDPAVRALARELGQVRRELDLVKAGQRASQLGNSSIEDGTLWFNDAAGIQRVGIGAQIDGKFGWFAVNGEAPPRPNTPQLVPAVNGVAIVWNGEFSGPAPSDFVHAKAYLSPVGQNFIPSDGNVVGHLLGASTLPVTPLDPNTDYYAVLIAYNTSGVASDPSFVAGPVRPTAVVATEILDGIVTDLKLADGAVSRAKIAVGAVGTAQIGNQQVDLSKLANGSVDATKIVDGSITPAKVTFTAADIGSIVTYYQASAPTGTIPTGSLWADSDDQNKLYRYSGSGWVAVNDQGVANALAAAQQAQSDAASAINTASGAQAAVAGKVTVYYQGTSPSGANTGDLWINTASNNTLQRWNGSAWIAVPDTRIASALASAQTAQSTADGKIQAFYQATAPTGVSVGDLWFNTSAGNAVSRWNGMSWVALPLGSSALADGSIISAKLASGAVTLGKLADGSVPGTAVVTDAITADKIATGAVGSTELSAGSVIAGKVAAGAIGTNELAANSVVAGKVAANTIGANEIIANSIVAGKLAADSVTSTNIVAGGVQTANLAADSVAAGKIAAEAVTAREIKALTITGDKIAANTIDAGQIKAGAVTADKLAAILVLASQIIAGDPNDWHLELGDSQTPILYWNNTETGFAVSRDQTTGQANVYMSGRVEFGNGSQIESDYLDLCEQVATGYQMPSLRQSRTLIYSEPVATPSPAPSWLSATGKGNLLYLSVLAANLAGSGAPTITVPAGWSAVRTVVGGASGSTRMTTYQIPGVSHTSSHTSEAISANVPCAWAIGLIEASGIQLSSPLDVVQSQTGSGGTASTGTTGTPTQGNEFQIAVFGTPGAGSPGKSGFSAPTNGFSLVSQGGGYNGQGSAVLTKIVTGALPASTQATVTPPNPWLGIIATFRTAPAAPVPEPPPARTVRLFTQSRGGASTPFVTDSAANVYPIGRVPYCKVRLTGDVFLPANTDIYAQSAWAPAGDPWGMVAISSSAGTFSNITIPFTGLYLVDLKVIYQQSTNTTSTVAAFVTKNGRDAANNSIARDARKYIQDGGDGTPVQASRQLVLTAGDVLYWGTFSSVNTNFYSGRLNIPTEITVSYMGVGG